MLRMPVWLPELLLLSVVLFGPLAFGAVEPWSLGCLQTLIFAMLFSCSMVLAPDLGGPVRGTLLPALVAVLLLGVLQRFNFRSTWEPSTFLPFTDSVAGTDQALLLWCTYATLLWCAPQVLADRAALRRFAWGIFLLGAVVAVVGIAQRGQGNNAYYGIRPIRRGFPFGPYTNYDHAASLMVMSAWMGCGIFFSRLPRFWTPNRMTGLADILAIQVLIAFILLLIFLGIWETGSRGGFNSMLVSGWVALLMASGRIRTGSVLLAARTGLCSAAVAYLAMLYSHPKWVGLVHGTVDKSTAYRLSMFHSGLEMFKDFPLFGVGLGGFMQAFPAYQEPFVRGVVEHIHNDWLELLLQGGIVGLACYAAGLVFYFRRVIPSWGAARSPEMRGLFGGALAAALAFLLHGLVDYNFHVPANAVVFLAILAFLGARPLVLGESAVVEPAGSSSRRSNKPRAFLCLFSSAMLALALRPVAAAWYCRKADNAPPSSRAYFLSKAVAWHNHPDPLYRLGRAYLNLAEENIAAKRVLLRDALRCSNIILDLDPLNPRYRYLQAAILWRLGRVEDGKRDLASSEPWLGGQ